ncbi:hypothetical protein C2I19_21545 [Chromobacterium alticapitis]|uniref:histidine kinase n=1 Tax=Chromobacterium alticapitis TaxID=2073169 RepID=A0A2S5DA11_9NEIS|nr:hypothetical protein C2I19_21545 [Chromobacterium alticapitis]
MALFRLVALLACLVLALQQMMLLWPVGLAGLGHLRERLPILLAGSPLGLRGAMAAYGACFAGFGWALWLATVSGARAPERGAKMGLLAAQIALALLASDKLLLLTAAEAALLLPRRAATACLAAQLALALLACGWQAQRLPERELACNVSGSDVQLPPRELRRWLLWQDAMVGGGFQLLTFGIGCLGAAERRRRAELEGTRASLLAARQLLAGTAGNGERLRMARELHDGMGHHLSALNLQLELLLRRGAGEAEAPLRSAQLSARRMLAEVRALVGEERRPRASPLREALSQLCEGARPAAALRWDGAPALDDAAAWQAFSAASEALAREHGRPCRLWLSAQDGGGAELRLAAGGSEEWTTIWREAER